MFEVLKASKLSAVRNKPRTTIYRNRKRSNDAHSCFENLGCFAELVLR
jgi:hypothetical protein